jgi:polyisoprenoid-binding protein YceI
MNKQYLPTAFFTMKASIRNGLFFVALTMLSASVFAEEETYAIDTSHSSVGFKVGHFFGKVPGRFQKFDGKIKVDRTTFEKGELNAEIDAASIDTANEKRDNHLRNADYFDVTKFPKITFVSKEWKKVGDNEADVTGDLTLHGVTKSVVMRVKALGFGEGKSGVFLSGWEGRTTIKRSEFGITSGAPAVGEDVEIEINVEGKKI